MWEGRFGCVGVCHVSAKRTPRGDMLRLFGDASTRCTRSPSGTRAACDGLLRQTQSWKNCVEPFAERRSAKSEERQDRDDNDHKADDVNDAAHGKPFWLKLATEHGRTKWPCSRIHGFRTFIEPLTHGPVGVLANICADGPLQRCARCKQVAGGGGVATCICAQPNRQSRAHRAL